MFNIPRDYPAKPPSSREKWKMRLIMFAAGIVLVGAVSAFVHITASDQYRRFNLKEDPNKSVYVLLQTKTIHTASGDTTVYLIRNNYSYKMATAEEVTEIESGPEEIKWPKP